MLAVLRAVAVIAEPVYADAACTARAAVVMNTAAVRFDRCCS
jgi:hypothetical protein